MNLLSREQFKAAPSADAHLRKQFVAEVKAEGEEGPIELAISTASVDRVGDTIALAGWRLDAYRKNPVVLFAHDSSDLPCAKSMREWIEGAALRSQAQFPTREEYAFGFTVGQFLRKGYLNAASVGFQPQKWIYNEERGGIDFMEQELLEYSIVPIPANPEALVSAKSAGLDLAPLGLWLEKALDGLVTAGLALPRPLLERAWKAAGAGGRVVFLSAAAKEMDPEAMMTRLDAACVRMEDCAGRLEKCASEMEEAMGEHDPEHDPDEPMPMGDEGRSATPPPAPGATAVTAEGIAAALRRHLKS